MNAMQMRKALAVIFWVWVTLVLAGCQTSDERILEPRAIRELIEKNKGRSDFLILDVRTPGEFRRGFIDGANLMDYYAPDFRRRFASLDRSTTILVYCHSGSRSSHVLRLADSLGFARVFDLRGGIAAWVAEGFPVAKGAADR